MAEGTRGETFVMQPEGATGTVTFHSFLLGLAASALIHLGDKPHPETGQMAPDLALARETLDLLAVLREKTRGNLTVEEQRLLDSLLADLRLQYVEKSQKR